MLKFIKVLLFVLLLSQFLVCSVKADCPAGDINGDCKVSFQDIGILAEQWLAPPESPADLNGDDLVNMADLALLAGQWHQTGIPVIINELMASNNSTIEDPQGQYDDWVELYNYSTDSFNAGGMYLTDDSANPTKWQIPAGTTIPADGYLLIWVDNDIADAGLHANFRIDAAGEELSLFGPDGSTLVDSIVFGEQVGNVSFGRYPNGGESWQFFGEPSPGSENDNVYEGFVDDVQFSHKRGFYNESFSLTLATETEDAEIYYTLDGTEPYRLSGRVRKGTVYSDPILIDQTTFLRAIAVKAGWKSSSIKTYTYIFVDDVIRQSPNGLSPGPGWPPNRVNGQVIDYGMDRDVVNDPRYSHQIKDALLAIPTISLVSELGDLFGASTGIYVNAQRDGRDWERPTSVELINPDGSEGFQIDAGMRIRGGFSRQGGNPKHAFRLFFRAEYGQAKLRFPLFGDEGVDEFDAVDLRTSQNYAWSFGGGSGRNNTMVREVFSRDLQGEMGQPYTRSRYYHLYINGHYWGLFQTQERSEASYAESYFNGDKEDYDVVKVDQGYSMTATDGDMDAYRRLYDATRYGLSDNEDYYRVQGLNPDGTPNPDYEKLLDVDNLIDFMIIDYYTADRDGPGSRYVNRPNNTYGIYNRNNPDGWKFFQHDSEHTMGLPGDSDNMVVPLTTSGSQWRYFNPHWLHERLANSNILYRQRFGDRVQKYLFNDGLLTPEASIARVDARAEQIELAIIAESARWGDSSRNSPYTQEHWFDAVEFVRN
ncbi:MAG: CotH kinase family protein, partial [Phycisphaerales bacterium]